MNTIKLAKKAGALIRGNLMAEHLKVIVFQEEEIEAFRKLVEKEQADKRYVELITNTELTATIKEKDAEIARLNKGWHEANMTVLAKDTKILQLKAHVERLRDCLYCYGGQDESAYWETPAQSLVTHDKAVREGCAETCDEMVLYTGLDCAEAIREMTID